MLSTTTQKNIELACKATLFAIKAGHLLTRTGFLMTSTLLGASSKLVGHFLPVPELGIGKACEGVTLKIIDGSAKLLSKGVIAATKYTLQRQ